VNKEGDFMARVVNRRDKPVKSKPVKKSGSAKGSLKKAWSATGNRKSPGSPAKKTGLKKRK
jgi:hypothetical protein